MDENLDDATVREIEEILHTKIYPGTEIMADVGTHHFVKSGRKNVLVPQPSDDPHDPLNWSPLWKSLVIFSATALSFTLNLGPLSLAPMFESYVKEWDRPLADAVQFTAVAILCLGFSNFIWVPIMVCFGRRPVAIISTAICLGTAIWRAKATSYDSFMGASILNGLAAGPCETLMPQVIADMIFLHDRGKYQTLYFSMYFISLMIGPIISGAMDTDIGWRSFWWFYTGLVTFTLIVNILFFPETRYRRPWEVPGASEKAPVVRDATADGVVEKETGDSTHLDKVKNGDENSAAALDKSETGAVSNGNGNGNDNALTQTPTHVDPALGRGAPSRRQFGLFQRYEGNLFRELWVPLYLHLFPIVEFSAFVVSWSASGYLIVNLSQTQVFAAPPYNYSSGTIGLFNLALFIGGLIGLFTSGPLSDWMAARLTARNNGVREPEMRLITMVPYVLLMILGHVLVGVGYDHHWAWQPIVVLGYACLGIQVAALPSIASTYAIDSYKPVTGSLFVTVTVNKNLWGYGMGKFLTPWAEQSGFIPPFMVNMALTTVFCLFGLVFWRWGKTFRGWTANSFVHKL